MKQTKRKLRRRKAKVDEAVVERKAGSYARGMLGLHKDIWKGLESDEFMRKERLAWARKGSSRA